MATIPTTKVIELITISDSDSDAEAESSLNSSSPKPVTRFPELIIKLEHVALSPSLNSLIPAPNNEDSVQDIPTIVKCPLSPSDSSDGKNEEMAKNELLSALKKPRRRRRIGSMDSDTDYVPGEVVTFFPKMEKLKRKRILKVKKIVKAKQVKPDVSLIQTRQKSIHKVKVLKAYKNNKYLSQRKRKYQALLKKRAVERTRRSWLQCPKCPVQSVGPKRHSQHLHGHEMDLKYRCPVRNCDYSARTEFILKLHGKSHGNPNVRGIWTCPDCPRVYAQHKNLLLHRNVHNPQNVTQVLTSNSQADPSILDSAHVTDGSRAETGSGSVSEYSGVAQPPLSDLRNRYRSSGAKFQMTFAEYKAARRGNPQFKYKLYSSRPNKDGVVVRLRHKTFHCLICPTSLQDSNNYLKHKGYHAGPSVGKFKCRACSFSCDIFRDFKSHLRNHSAQLDIDTHLRNFDEDTYSSACSGAIPKQACVSSEAPGCSKVHRLKAQENTQKSELATEKWQLTTVFPMLSSLLVQESTDAEAAVVLPLSAAAGVESNLQPKEEPKGFLVQHVKIQNFMCIKDLDKPVDQLITFQAKGKSAGIIALLLGLGYDTFFEPADSLSLCGWDLKDLVTRVVTRMEGEREGLIELTLSLGASAELVDTYGPTLKLRRSFNRGIPIHLSPITIGFRRTEAEGWTETQINRGRLREVLEKLGLEQIYMRAMVLELGNMELLKNDPTLRYQIFHHAVLTRKSRFRTEQELIEGKMQRCTCVRKCREIESNFYRARANAAYPKYNPLFETERQNDFESLQKLNTELAALDKELNELEEYSVSVLRDVEKSTDIVLQKMQAKYQEYLRLHDHIGNLLVDQAKLKLMVWVQPLLSGSDSKPPPSTVEEAFDSWSLTPPEMKTMSTMGLYLAFWSVMDTSPILVADAFSAQDCGFKFSDQGLPLLLELIKDCRGKGQQVIASLKDLPES